MTSALCLLLLASWPTLKSGGAAECRVGEPAPLVSGAAPRLPVISMTPSGGLALWLEDGQLLAQVLGRGGERKGAASKVAAPGASQLDALVETANTFVLLYRAEGSNQRLGAADQARIRLLALDPKGALVAGPLDVAAARWRDHPLMRFRAGALRLYLSVGRAYRTAEVKLPSLELSFSDTDGSWRSSALGPFWEENDELQVVLEAAKEPEADPQYVFRRRIASKELAPLTLPAHVLDYYQKDGDTLVVDNMFVKPGPALAWSGTAYFFTQVKRRGAELQTSVVPIRCGAAASPR